MATIIRIQREIELKREAGHIIIEPSRTVYLLVPRDIVKQLKTKHGIDLTEKDKSRKPRASCMLAVEGSDPKLIYLIESQANEREEIIEVEKRV